MIHARSGRNLHEPRANGGRTDQPGRACLRYLFAPAERAHHFRNRSRRGSHGGIDLHAAVVPRIREPEKRNLDVHQLAGRRSDVGTGDLRHHAVHSSAGVDAVHGPGRIDGIAAADRRREGHAFRAAERPHHGSPAVGRFPGPGHRHHAARPGNPEPEEAAERDLREAHRPDLQGDRGRAGARQVPDLRHGQGLRSDRQGDREARRRAGRAEGRLTIDGAPLPSSGQVSELGIGNWEWCGFTAGPRHGFIAWREFPLCAGCA